MASNSYTLEVIANTAKYQSELAKIPGLTEKQAAAAALKMAQAQEKAQQKMADTAEKEARRAAEAQLEAIEEVVDAQDEASEKIQAASEKAADGFGKVGETAGKLGGVLEMLGVEGAQNVADLADVGEVAAEAFGALGGSITVLGPLLAVVGTGVALLGGAMWVMADAASASSAAMEESKVKAEELKVALDAVNEAHKQTSETFKGAANDLAVATGGMEDYELAASNAAQAVRDGAQAEMDALTVLIMKTQAQLVLAQVASKTGDALDGSMAEGFKNTNLLTQQLKEQEKALSDLMFRTDDAAGRIAAKIIQDGEEAAAQKETAKATSASAAARTDETAALQKQAAALASLQQITAAAQRSMLTAAAQQAAAVQDQIATIAELERVSGDAAAAQAARDAVGAKAAKDADIYAQQQVEALQALTAAATEGLRSEEEIAAAKLQLDLDAIDRQANMAAEAIRLAGGTEAQITAIYEQALAARRAAEQSYEQDRAAAEKDALVQTANWQAELAAQNADNLKKMLGGYLDVVGNLINSTEEAIARAHERGDTRMEMSLERRLKSQKKAALVGYRIQQAADIAQATMSTIKGASDAFNSVFATVPYPANLVLAPVTAGLVAGAGAAQIAAIASTPAPSFRTGGIVPQSAPSMPGGYQDQRLISAEPGERIYNKQESAAIDRMLAGGSGPMVVQQVYRGRVVGQVVYDELQRAGRLRSALAGTKNAARSNPYIR